MSLMIDTARLLEQDFSSHAMTLAGVTPAELQALKAEVRRLQQHGDLFAEQRARGSLALLDPHDEENWWRLAMLSRANDEPLLALGCYQQLYLLGGDPIALLRGQAACLVQLGKPEVAAQARQLAQDMEDAKHERR